MMKGSDVIHPPEDMVVEDFINDEIKDFHSIIGTPTIEIYLKFVKWTKANNKLLLSHQSFSRRMCAIYNLSTYQKRFPSNHTNDSKIYRCFVPLKR